MKINPLLLKVGSEKEKNTHQKRWWKMTEMHLDFAVGVGAGFFLKYKVSPPVINGVK